jgi:hypothetical protein
MAIADPGAARLGSRNGKTLCERWSQFLRQPAKVGSSMRMTDHEDAETIFG